jgi:hypothetical protein
MNTMGSGPMAMMVTRTMEVKAELRRVPHPGGDRPGETGLLILVEGLGAELKPERVQLWLQTRPEWRLAPAGTVLHRGRAFPTCEAATHYSAFVLSLATALALPVKMKVRDYRVELSLFSPRHGSRFNPLTEAVLDFADRIG